MKKRKTYDDQFKARVATAEPLKEEMVERENGKLSIRRQCELLALNRSSLYYERAGLSEEEQRMLEEMDRICLDFPSYGSRRMGWELRRRGYQSRADAGKEADEASGGRGDLFPKEVEYLSHRASDLSLSTP
jgi:hypothetical protein